jgi:hypothetical protein
MVNTQVRTTLNVRQAYNMLPHGFVKEFKERLMRENGWNPSKFYLKIAGQWAVNDGEVERVKAAFDSYGINAEELRYKPEFFETHKF